MTIYSQPDSEAEAVRKWLEASSFSTNASWQFEPEALGSVSEQDVPRASPILAKVTKESLLQKFGEELDDAITEMHLRDLTQLSASFFDMSVILERVKHDLGVFSSRKVIQYLYHGLYQTYVLIISGTGQRNSTHCRKQRTSRHRHLGRARCYEHHYAKCNRDKYIRYF